MRVERLAIPDLKLISLEPHADARGLFVELWDERRGRDLGLPTSWKLDALSRQNRRGTIRAFHFQTPPSAQAKLVRVARGRALDVAVDIRRGSPSFGEHVAVELSEEIWQLFYIPVGFAHGFCALEDDTELHYKFSSSYSPRDNTMGLRWNDPALGVHWPVDEGAAILADRDRAFPAFEAFESPFRYEAEPIVDGR